MAKKANQNTYREERKERLAKAAKKNKQSTTDTVKLVTWIVRIITIAIVLGLLGFGLYQFGVPQKILPAVKVGDRSYSVAEYGYYYSSVFQSYAEQSNTMYQSYGYSVFDASKDPSLQTTTDEDGNKITYDELFRKSVITTLESTNYYLAKCEEEGIVLSDEHKTEIDTLIQSLASNAANNNMSISRYISIIYGKGLNEKMFVELLTEQYLVAQYLEDIEDSCFNDITDEELEAAYAADPSDFQSVDLRLFGFDVADIEGKKEEETTAATEETTAATEETTAATEETTAATEETTAATEETTADTEETTAAEEETTENKEPTKTELLAEEMLNRVKDEDSFIELALEYAAEDDKETFKNDTATLAKNIKKSVVESKIGEDLAEWLYSADRKTGDKTTYTTDDYVYVIYIIKPAYRIDEPLVDARHILVSFDEVAAQLKATEGNTINTEKSEDTKVESATTEEEIEISNEGTGYSIELVNEAYKLARDIYDKYMSGEKTEEAFAKLAEDNSHDTASIGDNGSGGLYESIERGTMVKAFEDWVYDAERETGDIDIVMTEYGWHVMYFVKKHDEPAWKASARKTLGTAAYEAIEEEVKETVSGTAKDAAFIGFAGNEACKAASKLYS